MAMGTSVGTITVLAPIAVVVATNGGLSLPLCIGTVVGGAMFGDNLSVISDTTIAATKTQGIEMKDKFLTNIKIACPAAILTLILLIVVSLRSTPTPIGTFEFNVLLALPYFVVLVLALLGINVFVVLLIGILLFLITGVCFGHLDYALAFSSMGDGTAGMF
jgi:Na+/H+ antiporter NhaC